MSANHDSTRSCRRRGGFGAQLFVLLALPLLGPAVAADEPGEWHLAPALDVRTATYFEYRGGAGSSTYPAVGAELSIELSSPEQPIAGGLFADFELTTSAAGDYSQLVGGWVRYRYGRWKLSTVGAHFKSGHMSGLWMHATRLQFELKPGHKLAVEAIGAIRGSGDPALQLVYKTNLTRQASLSIKIGLGSNRVRDFGASTKFVWNVY
jgi:hypothetical protein